MSYDENDFYYEPEEDDEVLDPTDGETILRALRGDFGEAAMHEAAELAGLDLSEVDAEPESDYSEDNRAWGEEFASQTVRLERELGRPLTGGEIDVLLRDHGTSSEPPNLRESYDQAIGRDPRNKEDRQAIGVEAYEEAEAAKEPAPYEPEYGFD